MATKPTTPASPTPRADSRASTLVIVESPTKARTIGGILGAQYTVLASKGHVADLPQHDLGYDETTFVPTYEVPAQKQAAVATLKAAARAAAVVIIATDPDREGEAIGWHIARLLRLRNPPRAEFHEITAKAIHAAIAAPRRLDKGLVSAQEARRILDRMVGYKASPALWRTVQRGLSAGRVQSVAMAMVADREREIAAFTSRAYWTVAIDLRTARNQTFPAQLVLLDGTPLALEDDKPPVLGSEALAQAALDHAVIATWQVATMTKQLVSRKPWPPCTTSSLQQAASAQLHFAPKHTMSAAQSLYERGLITYMRTDSVASAPEAVHAARTVIAATWGNEYLPAQPRVYANKATAQGAHECIRPTDLARAEAGSAVNADAQRLYQLIRLRFLAGQAADASYDQRAVRLHAQRCTCQALARASRVVFPGWLAISGTPETADRGDVLDTLPELAQGEVLPATGGAVTRHDTKPPARYTEASLIKALEDYGVGRPSTYAPTLSVLHDRGYVTKEGRALRATPIALTVTDWARARIPDLVDPRFTARVEENLDLVAEQKQDARVMLRTFADAFLPAVQQAIRAGQVDVPAAPSPPPASPTRDRTTRSRTATPRSTTAHGVAAPPARAAKSAAAPAPHPANAAPPPCPACAKPMQVRTARKGPHAGKTFLGCSGYPTCTHTIPIA